MAKMGRPKIDNPKVNKISVRLSDEEHVKLIEFAKAHSMTKAEAFKKGLELLYEQCKKIVSHDAIFFKLTTPWEQKNNKSK